EDDGTVYIGATDGPSAEAARAAINAIANPHVPEIGERFVGTVVKTMPFGAFISLSPGKDGLLHVSEIRKLVGGQRVENVDDVLSIGQKVQVEIGEIDPRGKLSLRAIVLDEDGNEVVVETPAREERPRRERSDRGERGDRGDRGDRPQRTRQRTRRSDDAPTEG
ncbi:MAG: S1 RNA-binding domain-containing protein, partial [Promicromonosporaceae bacterium]|nr:S1 RNA-binding domain-containing protein [Promicromonosporaceae bacterium]